MSKKRLVISEEQEKELIRILNEDSEVQKMPVDKKVNKPYCIDPDKVLIVKNHLDSRFKKRKMSKLGADGKPTIVKIVGMTDDFGNILKNMYMDQLKDYLVDNFQKMFLDKNELDLFMDKVMNSWYDDEISVHGLLNVNHL